jgi:hypothetical protein
MSLLAETVEALTRHDLCFAIVGATAMAAHGVARATLDVDLLLVGRAALESRAWSELRQGGVDVDIRRGAADDPLAGVVRLRRDGEAPIDVIVGTAAWQRRALERARASEVLGVVGPVAGVLDLILLKLYAGSPQDCWDISRLLASSAPELLLHVDAEVDSLPPECRELWKTLRDGER